MSVIDVTEMWSKKGGTITSAKFSRYDLTYSYSAGYAVLAEIGDDESVILAHSSVPKHGDQHPSGKPAFVTSINPQPIGPIFWHVIIGYEGSAPELDMPDGNVEVEWTDTTSTEAIDRDYDGAAIVTVNNEPVEGLTMEISDPVVVIRRKFLTFNAYTAAQYRHATNSDTFLGWPPGTARLVNYSAKNEFKAGAQQERWDVTARIQFRFPLAGATAAQAWYKRWRHEGFYDENGERFLDNRAEPTIKPVLLKTDGTKETDPNNAVFIYTQVYGSLPYGSLGLL